MRDGPLYPNRLYCPVCRFDFTPCSYEAVVSGKCPACRAAERIAEREKVEKEADQC